MNQEAEISVKPAIDNLFWLNEWWEQTARNINRMLSQFAPQPDKLLLPLTPDT